VQPRDFSEVLSKIWLPKIALAKSGLSQGVRAPYLGYPLKKHYMTVEFGCMRDRLMVVMLLYGMSVLAGVVARHDMEEGPRF